MGYYARKRRDFEAEGRHAKQTKPDSFKQVTRRLVAIAVPITIGASIMPLTQNMDSIMVVNRLTNIGYDQTVAKEALGLLKGSVNPLINMPAVLTLALCMSLVPAISAAVAAKKQKDMRQAASVGIKLAIIIGLPCSVGFFVLAEPILALLFHSSLSGQNLSIAAELLRVMSVGVLFLSLVQSVTGILQGLGKPGVAVVNLAIGAALKLIISFVLIGIPKINIIGAAVGTCACYAVAGILDTAQAVRRTQMDFSVVNCIVKPVAAAFCMGAFAYFAYFAFLEHAIGPRAGVLVTILVAAFVYICILVGTKTFTKADFALIPGGDRLYNLLRHIGIYENRGE